MQRNMILTTARLRECLNILNWSSETLAHVVHVCPSLTLQWAEGVSTIPPETGQWLSTLAALHAEARRAIAVGSQTHERTVH